MNASTALSLPDLRVDRGGRTVLRVAALEVAAGETVFDVPPVLASRVRVLGSGRSQKNDPNDARSVAIAALRSDRLAQVRPDDHVRVLRLLALRESVG